MTQPRRALSRVARSGVARWRLLCIPHAGAGASALAGWAANLPADCDLVIARLAGRESRYAETPATDICAAAADLLPVAVPLADLPLVVFGYSMGALIAYELVRTLSAEQQRLPVLLAVGGHNAPDTVRRLPALHDLPPAEFIAAVRALGGTPEEVFEHPELFELVERTLRADLRLVESYDHRPGPMLSVPVATYTARDDDTVDPDGVAAWGT